MSVALRGALGIALCAHACFLLGIAGWLHPVPIVIAIVVIAMLSRPLPISPVLALGAVPLVLLALYPPIAFDETVYHLPFVRAFAHDGAIRFLPQLRFPVFPVLQEALAVPAFLVAGDRGAHLVAVVEAILLAALLVEWARGYEVRARWLAAAIVFGSPIMIKLATVLYVEMALMLFVTAGFYALDSERPFLAGVFLGSACSVKYLGFYFALAALVIVIVRTRRSAVRFALGGALAALPMTIWIYANTGDPLFPFLRPSLWTLAPAPPMEFAERILRMVRVIWDATFARERIGLQPPVTPFLAVVVLLVLAAAVRDLKARMLVVISAVYVAIFTFLPQDARYLMPLLPLMSVAAAVIVARKWPRAATILAIVAVAPGLAYAGYRLAKQGLPPSNESAWLEPRVPGYRAVRLAGKERIYACGAEQLKAYAQGEYLGDFNGPWSYGRVLAGAETTQQIAERLRRIDARYFLVAKRRCASPRADGGMELVYEDADTQLWRMISRPLPPRTGS